MKDQKFDNNNKAKNQPNTGNKQFVDQGRIEQQGKWANSESEQDETFADKAGDAIEKMGDSLSKRGAPNMGKKIHDLGDKIEKHHTKPDHSDDDRDMKTRDVETRDSKAQSRDWSAKQNRVPQTSEKTQSPKDTVVP